MLKLNGKNFEVDIDMTEHSGRICGGSFGEVKLLSSPLFEMRVKNLSVGGSRQISSFSRWEQVSVSKKFDNFDICFKNPEGLKDIAVNMTAKLSDFCIRWSVEVVNNNAEHSVMEATYPTPQMTAEYLDYFVPLKAGVVIPDATRTVQRFERVYPHWGYCMQYFAVYGRRDGIYIGIEDGKAASKRFTYETGNGECKLKAEFFGIGASLPANSFSLWGECNWQYFEGDWYDAALIYANFVKRNAEWLPEITENGRPDTPDRFKEVPFWICDYIPNSESQGDNKPKNISAGTEIYPPDYWYRAPIELKNKLGVPVAYHVYNWHEIPFNIEYPHFLPARQEFLDHAQELRDNGVYVLPYINAISWEMNDADAGYEMNFSNEGHKHGVVQEDGTFFVAKYPQYTKTGKESQLVPICGSSKKWHSYFEYLSREMEKTLPIDGIYYDEVSANPGVPCFNKDHSHLPGGGNFRVTGYNEMMKKINAEKPKDNFNFSECNAEAFMKSFDGFLTWMWVDAGQVPAFPAVYAGYIQMIGRCTHGVKKDDFEFFKYCTANSLTYGQQIGWYKADIVYSNRHMEFLKPCVDVRYKYTKLFNGGRMLRPATVHCGLPKLKTSAGLWFDGEIVSDRIATGSWTMRDGSKTVIFAVNMADTAADFTLEFKASEYGITDKKLPDSFALDGDICKITVTADRYEVKVWEI